MTPVELKAYIATQLTAPVNEVAKLIDSLNAMVDFITSEVAEIIPDWSAGLTFQTDGSDDGSYCIYADTNGKLRIWETKVDNNTNNLPPSAPGTTENTYWLEVSSSASAAIPEWAPGLFGPGLIIVFHNHSTDGRGLYVLLEPVRPFNSVNIETEIAAGDWELISGGTSGGPTPNLSDVLTEGNDAGSNYISNLADPTNPQDAATKNFVQNYVLSALSGLKWKDPCLVATTAPITLSGWQTIDGIAVQTNDRVLVKDQASQDENGIWVVGAFMTGWTRATDADNGTELYGATVTVMRGTANADTTWTQINETGSLPSSMNIAWAQVGSSVPNASTTAAGKVEKALQAEVEAGTQTGGTGAELFVNPVELKVITDSIKNKLSIGGMAPM